MAIGFITVLAMSVFSCAVWKWQKEKGILYTLIYGQMYFWSTYILLCAVLIWLDIFQVGYAAVGSLCVSLIAEGICYTKCVKGYHKREKAKSWDKKDILTVLLCILIAVAIHDKNGLMGMSQDEGVYQTAAISFIKHNSDNQKNLEEYEILDGESQVAFSDKLKSVISQGMHGYYLHCEEYFPRNLQKEYSAVSGYYHGVPTYAATLALWGSIFGWKQMMGVQSIFYILAVLLFYEMIRPTRLSAGKQLLLVAVYALSPIMIWLGKSSLTELLLACLLNWFLCELLSEGDEKFKAVRIALPVITFAFVHLTIYTLMPMIIVCLLIRFWDERGLVFLRAGLFISAGYLAGILFTAWCATEYFYLNIEFLIRLLGCRKENILPILCLAGVISAALFVVLYLYKEKLFRLSTVQCIWGLRVTAGMFTAGSIWIIVRTILNGGHWEKLTIISYAALTGIFILPAVLVFMITKAKIYCADKKNRIIAWFFLYCILFYAILFRREIINHYYGDRYLAPFCVAILLMTAIAMEYIPAKWIGQYGLVLCSLAALVYFADHDYYIIKNKDDTRIEWTTLEEICENLNEEDILILGDNQMISCFFTIRDLTGALCYPIFGRDIEDTVDKLLPLNKNIYILGNTEELPIYANVVGEWEVGYREYTGREDLGFYDPLEMVNTSSLGRWILIRK